MSTNLNRLQGQPGGGAHAYASSLRWIGDNIIGAGGNISIAVRAPNGTVVSLSLAGALALADKIDARGLYRITSGARHALAMGELSNADAAVWRQWEAQQ
ncbi:hypothetical protein [Ralstonia solanacearum]|uniref:hypothetical protein n=1 Tax=Ralstonia solanacearum TaxID=305 RepID=UPI001FFA6536